MQEINDLQSALQNVDNEIKKNLTELTRISNYVSIKGAQILPDWSIVPQNDIPLEVIQKLDILGTKTEDLTKEKERLEAEFILACENEVQKQYKRLDGFKLSETVKLILKRNVASSSRTSIYAAVLELKKQMDMIVDKKAGQKE